MLRPEQIEIQEAGIPTPGSNEVLVKVRAVGICTWEQRFYHGKEQAYPFVGGHEISGVVVKVGHEVVQGLRPGDKVAVASLTRCGECYYCRRGMDHMCIGANVKAKTGEKWGPGGFSEYMVAKGYEVYKLHPDVKFTSATISEPLACVIHSVNKSHIRLGDLVVVIGAGIMGLLHLKVAMLRGARVVVSEPDPERRERARENGAAWVVDPAREDLGEIVKQMTEGRGANVVFFTAGGAPAIHQGLKLLEKGGALIIYGSVHPAQPIELNPNDIHYDEYIITGSIRHDRESFREATEMISRGLIGVDDLVSETVPFERIENAFQRAGLLDTYRVVLTFGE